MNSRALRRHRADAFSLIEIICVLAVLAILSGLLIPKVFEAIHRAAISQAATSLIALKTACTGHYARYSSIAMDGSTSPPSVIALDGSDGRAAQFDKILLLESLTDGLFSPRIGDRILGSTNTRIQIVTGLPASATPDASNAAYNLDGSGNNRANGSVVIEAIITGVSLEDARALNELLDGSMLGENQNGDDLLGRVKYGSPTGSNGNGNPGNSGSANRSGNGGNNSGNGNGQGNGQGNGGNNNGNGNGGSDNGNGNGGNGNPGNGNGGGTTGTQTPTTLTVHVYLAHQ